MFFWTFHSFFNFFRFVFFFMVQLIKIKQPVGRPAGRLHHCLSVYLCCWFIFFFHRPFKTNTFNRSKLEFLYLNLSIIYRIECSFDSIQLIRFTRILFVLLQKLNWIFFSSFFFAKHHTTHSFNRLSTGLIFFWICLFVCLCVLIGFSGFLGIFFCFCKS